MKPTFHSMSCRVTGPTLSWFPGPQLSSEKVRSIFWGVGAKGTRLGYALAQSAVFSPHFPVLSLGEPTCHVSISTHPWHVFFMFLRILAYLEPHPWVRGGLDDVHVQLHFARIVTAAILEIPMALSISPPPGQKRRKRVRSRRRSTHQSRSLRSEASKDKNSMCINKYKSRINRVSEWVVSEWVT